MSKEEFKQQVYPLHEMLYNIAFRFLQSRELTEDVIQDVFLKLWEKRIELSKIKSIRAFAITMTRNAALDKIRTKKYTVEDDVLAQQSGINNFDNSEQVDIIKKVIHQLPEQQKRVIELRDIDGLEYVEIGEILGMELVTIRANLSIARKKVRQQIGKIYSYGLE